MLQRPGVLPRGDQHDLSVRAERGVGVLQDEAVLRHRSHHHAPRHPQEGVLDDARVLPGDLVEFCLATDVSQEKLHSLPILLDGREHDRQLDSKPPGHEPERLPALLRRGEQNLVVLLVDRRRELVRPGVRLDSLQHEVAVSLDVFRGIPERQSALVEGHLYQLSAASDLGARIRKRLPVLPGSVHNDRLILQNLLIRILKSSPVDTDGVPQEGGVGQELRRRVLHGRDILPDSFDHEVRVSQEFLRRVLQGVGVLGACRQHHHRVFLQVWRQAR
mmetsp:Transcript_137991/g.344514  ORF Transcript_137991/g.344514 Transcript_137991/m.344514 type:complete len:275 (+) Transcript_137991:89-913(+)